MTDEYEQFRGRLSDLARRASVAGYYLYTDFLGLAEQSVFASMRRALGNPVCRAYGGAEGCERVMIRFGDPEEFGYDEPFPIRILRILPAAPKFAEALTHRDYLGAILNLGIERDTIGDIVVREGEAYLFVKEELAPYLTEELTRVRHTDVRVSEVSDLPDGDLYRTERRCVQANGERLDAVIAKIFSLSREDALKLFAKKQVFVDGRQCENNSYTPKPGEVISVRGYGRMIYRGYTSLSRKGKLNIEVDVYV